MHSTCSNGHFGDYEAYTLQEVQDCYLDILALNHEVCNFWGCLENDGWPTTAVGVSVTQQCASNAASGTLTRTCDTLDTGFSLGWSDVSGDCVCLTSKGDEAIITSDNIAYSDACDNLQAGENCVQTCAPGFVDISDETGVLACDDDYVLTGVQLECVPCTPPDEAVCATPGTVCSADDPLVLTCAEPAEGYHLAGTSCEVATATEVCEVCETCETCEVCEVCADGEVCEECEVCETTSTNGSSADECEVCEVCEDCETASTSGSSQQGDDDEETLLQFSAGKMTQSHTSTLERPAMFGAFLFGAGLVAFYAHGGV